jgi:CRP/FNR family transcriptional regulator, cyclic AMP receptor protein
MEEKKGEGFKITESIIDFLIDIPLFDELHTAELKILAQHMNVIEVQRNDILFREGDKGSYMCFVVDGILDVLKQTAASKEVVISSLARGRSIGEMSVIDSFPRSATVRARTVTTLVVLTRERFDSLLKEQPPIGIKILKSIARLLSMNLRKTSSQLADVMLPIK